MLRVAPDLERIAARLTAHDLRGHDDDDDDLFAARTAEAFVDTYSEQGLRRALTEYGVFDDLAARGLGDNELKITREDHYRHRLEITLLDGSPVMDMRLHLAEHSVGTHVDKRVGTKGSGRGVDDKDAVPVAVVLINWLLMQHPRQPFSSTRPRLPGQQHPGTGMGRKVQELLVLLCRRLGRDGLVSVPERFHLSVLYRRIGFFPAVVAETAGVDAALAAAIVAGISFDQLAWAVERGFVVDERGLPWVYTPHTLICPVSSRLQRLLRAQAAANASSSTSNAPLLRVDLDGLRASLANDPVDGVAQLG